MLLSPKLDRAFRSISRTLFPSQGERQLENELEGTATARAAAEEYK
jgi:hypothetical protein